MRIFIVLIALILVVGCAPAPKDIIKEEFRQYRITNIDRPKHFHVNLVDVNNGQVLTKQGRSKHCSNWRQNTVGDIIVVKTRYYRQDDGKTYIDLIGLNDILCR